MAHFVLAFGARRWSFDLGIHTSQRSIGASHFRDDETLGLESWSCWLWWVGASASRSLRPLREAASRAGGET